MADKFHIRNGKQGLVSYNTDNDAMTGIAASKKPEEWLVFECGEATDIAEALGVDWLFAKLSGYA